MPGPHTEKENEMLRGIDKRSLIKTTLWVALAVIVINIAEGKTAASILVIAGAVAYHKFLPKFQSSIKPQPRQPQPRQPQPEGEPHSTLSHDTILEYSLTGVEVVVIDLILQE